MIIGIYGTIGSGKTFISKTFFKQDFKIIECDTIAKEIVNNLSFQKILKIHFPMCFDGENLNRSKLRKLISFSETDRLKLNLLVWPKIKNKIISILKNTDNYVIDCALLPEFFLPVDCYIKIKCKFLTVWFRIWKRDKKSWKETKAIYKKQKNALKKFKNLKHFKIKNNFWNFRQKLYIEKIIKNFI